MNSQPLPICRPLFTTVSHRLLYRAMMTIKPPLLFLLFAVSPLASGDNIYRCEQADGGVSLQQQPCSTGEAQQTYAFSNRQQEASTRGPAPLPERDRTPRTYQPETAPRRSNSQRANPVGKRLNQCRKLWNREQDLRDTEREGYTASEGEKIRRKLRRIKREKKLLRCDELSR